MNVVAGRDIVVEDERDTDVDGRENDEFDIEEDGLLNDEPLVLREGVELLLLSILTCGVLVTVSRVLLCLVISLMLLFCRMASDVLTLMFPHLLLVLLPENPPLFLLFGCDEDCPSVLLDGVLPLFLDAVLPLFVPRYPPKLPLLLFLSLRPLLPRPLLLSLRSNPPPWFVVPL